MAQSLLTQLENHLEKVRRQYFAPDDFFVLGVSGGPDSMALMYLLKRLEISALIVHVNYGKRDEASDLDQELAEQMAFQWGFECCTIPLNPEDAGDENFQNWARKQRYRFFRDFKEEYDAAAILTAHHQDDQVETILQKLLRGSAPEAWQGMSVWDGELFRPLLPFTKQQILDYCDGEVIPYRVDESNLQSDYARNFLRNELAEQMDGFFPGWQQNILKLQEQGERFEAAMQQVAGQVAEKNMIDLTKYSALPDNLKTSVLKTILKINGLEQSLSRGEWQQLKEIEHIQTGTTIEAGNLRLTSDRGQVVIQAHKEQASISYTFKRGEVESDFKTGPVSLKLVSSRSQSANLQVDADKLQWPLTLREWQEGDRFTPLGLSGSQNIAKHLTSRKIPAHLKEKALVLCGSDGTIYAIIYPVKAENNEWGAVAEEARYHPQTEIFLTINLSI
ncbi:tRNA lysidine(34) synthetase TilS [Gracilimonas mengyeensis]|uniref:tRNA(Ile)-lysidine synthase n=1 Tax=Gracilimonas mengyeensis TaxID=1302730 RepID=A0A521CCZ3_9BACT|nr:tRNA lysidine(34) synthetase TilS [Gracilimonas mengyeensis]SMO57292.1 tRNA(Ile)-lysidine synthase [Gracilimonas mengyeensis]